MSAYSYVVSARYGDEWKRIRTSENKQVALDLAKNFSPFDRHVIVEEFLGGVDVGVLIYENRRGKQL